VDFQNAHIMEMRISGVQVLPSKTWQTHWTELDDKIPHAFEKTGTITNFN